MKLQFSKKKQRQQSQQSWHSNPDTLGIAKSLSWVTDVQFLCREGAKGIYVNFLLIMQGHLETVSVFDLNLRSLNTA